MTTRPEHRTRTGAVITSLAMVIGLWLGLTAPQISPVAPAPTPTTSSLAAAR